MNGPPPIGPLWRVWHAMTWDWYPGKAQEVQEAIALATPVVTRPGYAERKAPGIRAETYWCQDCGLTGFPTIMLVTPLWQALYPQDGFACPSCIEGKLGFRLAHGYLKPGVPCNEFWLAERERRATRPQDLPAP